MRRVFGWIGRRGELDSGGAQVGVGGEPLVDAFEAVGRELAGGVELHGGFQEILFLRDSGLLLLPLHILRLKVGAILAVLLHAIEIVLLSIFQLVVVRELGLSERVLHGGALALELSSLGQFAIAKNIFGGVLQRGL